MEQNENDDEKSQKGGADVSPRHENFAHLLTLLRVDAICHSAYLGFFKKGRKSASGKDKKKRNCKKTLLEEGVSLEVANKFVDQLKRLTTFFI